MKLLRVDNGMLGLEADADPAEWKMWLTDETEVAESWQEDDDGLVECERRVHPDSGLEYLCVCEVGGGYYHAFLLDAERA